MKIAHISDSHLGYAQYNLSERRADFFKAFKLALKKIIDLKVDLVIHTGDLFESVQPDMATLSKVIKALSTLKEAGIPVVTIAGNHDRVMRMDKVSPHRLLSDIGMVKTLDPLGDTVVNGVYIAGMSFIPKSYMDSVRKRYFNVFSERASRYSFSIFMFHQGLHEYLPHAYEMNISDLPDGFSYYAGGHIHRFIEQRVKSGVFSYAGITEFRSSDEVEGNSRGFNIIDTETGKLERISLNGLRPFFTLKVNEENFKEEVENLTEKVKGLSEKPLIVINYSFKKDNIDMDMLDELKSRALYVKVITRKIEEDEQKSIEKLNVASAIEKYFEGQPEEVKNLAVSIAQSSDENVSDILMNFLEAKTKRKWKL